MNTNSSSKLVLFFILKTLRLFPWSVFLMFMVAIIWAIDTSLRPYLLKIIIDRLAEPSTVTVFEYIGHPIIFYLFMTFSIVTIFRFYDYFIVVKMIPALRRTLAIGNFSILLNQSYSYYQNHFAGSLANKESDLTSSVPEMMQLFFHPFFSNALSLSIAIFTLWHVNTIFAISMSLWIFICITIALFLSKKLTKLADISAECNSTITGKVVDSLSNILSIRLFARAHNETATLTQSVDQAVLAEQNLQWSFFKIWFSYGYSFFTIQAISLYVLFTGHQAGWITIGDFVVVLSLNNIIIENLWHLTGSFARFSTLWGKSTQALRTIMVTPDIQDTPNATTLNVTQGRIVFERVVFQYKDTAALFNNKSIIIESGEKVGLVGYSGSGKSTFANIILRLYDISGGHIFIDDQDIQQVTQDSLHRAIAMIPQDPALFHRTLMENIRYGRIEATDEEVIQSAKDARAHEFISILPQGYQSLVGERGIKLSGGQRQRIAIARAILKNAPILMLDEATSQLDSVTENDIQDSLLALMQHKTTLIIAHRLSTLLHMDRILVFDQGKIVEEGSHTVLLKQNGLYKILWDAQVGGFLPTAMA